MGEQIELKIISVTSSYYLREGNPTISLINNSKNYLTVVDLGSGFGGDMEKVARWYKGPLKVILIDVPLNITTAFAYISSCFETNRKKLYLV